MNWVMALDLLQVMKYGEVDDLYIYHHPITNKHLGLARVMFASVKAAKECVERLDRTPVMGKTLRVFLDAFGNKYIYVLKFNNASKITIY